MSRIGKKPVSVPSNVTATVAGQTVKMKGPKGELAFIVPEGLKVEKGAEGVEISMIEDTKPNRSKWGMSRTQIANLIKGCLLYTSDAADDLLCVDLGGRRLIKKKKQHIHVD